MGTTASERERIDLTAKALAEERRRQILSLVDEDEMSAGEIAAQHYTERLAIAAAGDAGADPWATPDGGDSDR